MNEIESEHNLNLYPATNGPIITLEQNQTLHKILWSPRRSTIYVVETLSIKRFIRTDFVEKYITSIHSQTRRLKPISSNMGAILSMWASDKLAIATASSWKEEKHRDGDLIKLNRTQKMLDVSIERGFCNYNGTNN